ncbi:hypothetical protein K437DRAFT_171630 [Tilletiaria anomala UBC 951]|uniref:Uncharacterized protein n=1 Tax=Tilletiaria anomala (strain ATCC 24038 / CBS 436.72 / UBC 951) TaxID=1037660 RepID=A0A066VS13_TILAU|nr:uncharacterized protein K437DRAFT_171630 [Tilletiaria anomala UBC 951]KDN41594.1 hypothetical protein K437DRAFT_171630 [Tilletiaria anomala UBC 951]
MHTVSSLRALSGIGVGEDIVTTSPSRHHSIQHTQIPLKKKNPQKTHSIPPPPSTRKRHWAAGSLVPTYIQEYLAQAGCAGRVHGLSRGPYGVQSGQSGRRAR